MARMQAANTLASTHAWWADRPTERFWLESTDRSDIGADLRAPSVDESGRPNWRYSLFQAARPGDVVYHYHKPAAAIVGRSMVTGPAQARSIVWGARGTFARSKGVLPHERPGYFVPLDGFEPLRDPLSLAALRAAKGTLGELVDQLKRQHPRRSLYFPFEISARPVRLLQGYAFKLPADFVAMFDLDPVVMDGGAQFDAFQGDAGLAFPEGAVRSGMHHWRERRPELRTLLLASRRSSGSLRCDACGDGPKVADTDIAEAGFEVHHVVPLADVGERHTTTSDLALLCATCHRLLHRAIQLERTWVTVDQLAARIRKPAT